MTSRFDVCAKCEQFRFQLGNAIQEDDKVRVSSEFSEHVERTQQQREYYISLAKQSESQFSTAQDNESSPDFAH